VGEDREPENSTMGGGGVIDESQFAHYKGFKKYFNSDTVFGKRNCVVAVYGLTFFSIWYVRRRMNAKKALTDAAPPAS